MANEKLVELGDYIKTCGGYMEASRRSGIFWLNLRRWAKGEAKPCLANRHLLRQIGVFFDETSVEKAKPKRRRAKIARA
jgi:hypothetical protein